MIKSTDKLVEKLVINRVSKMNESVNTSYKKDDVVEISYTTTKYLSYIVIKPFGEKDIESLYETFADENAGKTRRYDLKSLEGKVEGFTKFLINNGYIKRQTHNGSLNLFSKLYSL
jgi:hypothetical protein